MMSPSLDRTMRKPSRALGYNVFTFCSKSSVTHAKGLGGPEKEKLFYFPVNHFLHEYSCYAPPTMIFACFDSLSPSQQFFSYVGMGLPGLNQY